MPAPPHARLQIAQQRIARLRSQIRVAALARQPRHECMRLEPLGLRPEARARIAHLHVIEQGIDGEAVAHAVLLRVADQLSRGCEYRRGNPPPGNALAVSRSGRAGAQQMFCLSGKNYSIFRAITTIPVLDISNSAQPGRLASM